MVYCQSFCCSVAPGFSLLLAELHRPHHVQLESLAKALPTPGSGSEVTKQRWILRNQRLSHKIPPRNWKSRGHLPKESSHHRFNDKIALLRGPLTTLLNVQDRKIWPIGCRSTRSYAMHLWPIEVRSWIQDGDESCQVWGVLLVPSLHVFK